VPFRSTSERACGDVHAGAERVDERRWNDPSVYEVWIREAILDFDSGKQGEKKFCSAGSRLDISLNGS
jgi:hypothetical protein